jgi:2-keto-4-pentenoate hydratase/2-oxohepta-3-ene-1,7-dioic acid hydratase in catechol pathway
MGSRLVRRVNREMFSRDLALVDDDSLADPMVAISRTKELRSLSAGCSSRTASGSVAQVELAHFTKFPSCIVGPTAKVSLTGRSVHWEVEIVAVIGAKCSSAAPPYAWSVVAGLMLGQLIGELRNPCVGGKGACEL